MNSQGQLYLHLHDEEEIDLLTSVLSRKFVLFWRVACVSGQVAAKSEQLICETGH